MPNVKVEAKVGQKYIPKTKEPKQEEKKPDASLTNKHQIWSEEEVKELPVSLNDPR
jgi:hypothetical protein